MKKPRTIFFIMVDHPDGPRRVGRPFSTRENAREWVCFVRSYWNLRVTIRSCRITFSDEGVPDKKSRKRLSEEFNCEVRGK
jgi:hypothetical protein